MKVKDLIEKLETIEDKTLDVIFADGDPFCGGNVNCVEVSNIDGFGKIVEPRVVLSDCNNEQN